MLDLQALWKRPAFRFRWAGVLKDYGIEKAQWLQQCPPCEMPVRALEGTSQLERLGQHLQVRRGSYSRDCRSAGGCLRWHIRPRHSIASIHGTVGSGGGCEHRSSVGRRYGSTDRPDDLFNWNVENSAADVCESAGTMLRADYVEAGQMPVVLANRFGGVIFREACATCWKPPRSNGAPLLSLIGSVN